MNSDICSCCSLLCKYYFYSKFKQNIFCCYIYLHQTKQRHCMVFFIKQLIILCCDLFNKEQHNYSNKALRYLHISSKEFVNTFRVLVLSYNIKIDIIFTLLISGITCPHAFQNYAHA